MWVNRKHNAELALTKVKIITPKEYATRKKPKSEKLPTLAEIVAMLPKLSSFDKEKIVQSLCEEG